MTNRFGPKSFVVCYYRDEESVRRYREFGGIIKESGYQYGGERFPTEFEAQKLADRINSFRPKVPARAIPSNDEINCTGFTTATRWK